jgi:rifampicin phosphotransferase
MSTHDVRDAGVPDQDPATREESNLPLPLQLSLGLIASAFVFAPDALAIPSPDVVIGLFASVAQVLGLLSVLAGGWLWRKRKQVASESSSRGWKIACIATSTLFVFTCIGWGLYAAAKLDARAKRLQVNLERSSKEDGKKITDVSLKELAFSDQLRRSDGIPTDEVARAIEQGRALPMLDVRENEEIEVGRIQGCENARFPDVLATPEKYLTRGKETLLLCYNGNRSSELASTLEEKGFTCRFMVGGYEKWLAEERPLQGSEKRTGADLRQVPAYPNRDVLLDTPDVLALMEAGPVLFLDVRYPAEFEGLGHLPGAVDMPFRKLRSDELEAALDALPHLPVIVPCYDKRSSFYGLVTGLRLARKGYTFVGRYTTPETFPSLSKDKPHVAAWKARHSERTLLSVAAAAPAGWIETLAQNRGSLALAVLLAALALRLLLVPLTVRADRDRIVQWRLQDERARIDREHAHDPAERSLRTMELLRAHGIRPMFGLVSGMLQLVLFSVLFAAVGQAARETDGGLWWIEKLADPDPLRVLPIACGLLAAGIVLRSAQRTTRLRFALSLCFGALVAAILLGCSAAVGVYLCTSLLFVLVQGELMRGWLVWRPRFLQERLQARATAARIAPLELSDLCGDCGNKAMRLARLARAGFRVPSGFVVRPVVVRERIESGRWSEQDRAAIQSALASLGSERVAVRSSGASEDGEERSFAGVFESVLDVHPEQVFEALERVLKSFSSARARSYAGGGEQAVAILVQAMVPAEYAGVLFTEHPAQTGSALVELVAGLGESLVSGRSKPRAFRLGRLSGRVLDAGESPIPLGELHHIGLRIERVFGRIQDIEWAFAGGEFHVLQSRDVTCDAAEGEGQRALRERERRRLLALASQRLERVPGFDVQAVFLEQDELAELLPEPTPASLSLLNAISARNGSTDLACRELGLRYDAQSDAGPAQLMVFGRCCSIAGERSRRLSGKTPLIAGYRLGRQGEELERELREEFLPEHTRCLRLEDALDLARLELPELIALQSAIVERFLGDSYREAERINLAAEFYVRSAVAACEKHGLDPASLLAHLPPNVTHEALGILARVGRGEARLEEFLRVYGQRADHDYELAEPRYRETPAYVEELAARGHVVPAHETSPELPAGKLLRLSIERARRFQALKEEAKHAALGDLASLRRVLLEIGARLAVDQGIFQLTLSEVAGIGRAGLEAENIRGLVQQRLEEVESLNGLRLPMRLSVAQLEELDLERGEFVLEVRRETSLGGTRVSGEGDVLGRARVLHGADEIDSFQKGEILVARFTDPAWMPVFPVARGLVMEVGGWLSHAAIQAREYGLTCIVGVEGAPETIQTGELIQLHRDGRVERLSDRRREERLPAAGELEFELLEQRFTGQLVDRSARGAQIVLDAVELRIGARLLVRGLSNGETVPVFVARNGRPGNYGLSLDEPQASAATRPALS